MFLLLKCFLGWRLFDDSYVKDVHESNIVTNDAYVLFYRRRESVSNNLNQPPINIHHLKTSFNGHDEEFYSCEEATDGSSDSEQNSSSSDSYTNLNELD
jgi:hypothetical protein